MGEKRSEIKCRFLYFLQLTCNQQYVMSTVLMMLARESALTHVENAL